MLPHFTPIKSLSLHFIHECISNSRHLVCAKVYSVNHYLKSCREIVNFLCNVNNNNRGQLNPNSEWLQSDSESEADIDEEQFLLNANDMANDDGSSTSSESVDNLDDFVIQDEYLDDDLEPDLLNPVPARSESDNDSTNSFPDSDLDPDNYLLDPEGLNLINPVEDNNDSELENYLLGPEGVYLDNQGWSESNSDNDLDFDLDPELPSGPVDPG